ncbi:phosphate transporter [Pavlovales sp. CCMP2436]|nr:phosphate transporter [Pavlovales sp. CCMP2436]
MVVAAIFEFAGAVLLGSQVSETIRKGISNPKCFTRMPAVLMWGMCSVNLAVGIWLLVATSLELPVSTTHSAVGGVIGFTLVAVGSNCVVWNAPSDEFPYVTGVASIVLSWVFSPVLSGILSALIFWITRTFVLRAPNSTERAIVTYPILIAFCVAMIVAYVVAKGTKSVNDLWGFDAEGEDLWLLCVFSVGSGLVAAGLSLFLKPTIRRAVEAEPEEGEATKLDLSVDMHTPAAEQKKGVLGWIQRKLDTDVDQFVADDARSAAIHALAEKFPPKTEVVFKFMQVMTACFDSFAHGSNDVANAMGPFAAVYYIYAHNGDYGKKNVVGYDMYWILVLGGAGIVLGLGTYGYKIMFALGLKLAKITPSRGFGIELGSMFVVLLGSRFGIPLSTTHCQVGSTIGVSLCEGRASSTNWVIVGKCVIGWIATMIVAGGLTATIFSIGYATIDFDSSQKLSKGWQGF